MMWGYGGLWTGGVLMILVWLVFAAGVVWLVRGAFDSRDAGHPSARQVLDARFAAGEISEEDYQTRRRALR